ncbi:MAG: PIN domain-containing protein [Candidatus Obscuribacterales bacterium]
MEKPSGYTALLDSSVLFPIFGSNLLLFMADSQIFKVKWSKDIHVEWIDSRMKRYPDGDRAALERKQERMDKEFAEAMVSGYEPLIESLSLVDLNDRHVLAAAIKCRADVIVTENIRHFPSAVLEPLGLFSQTADDFIADQIGLTPESEKMVAIAVVRHKKSMTRSRLSWQRYFEELAKRLPQSFAEFNQLHFRETVAMVLVSGEWRY